MRGDRERDPSRLLACLAGVGCLILSLTACAQPATAHIGIGPSDVDHVEAYRYAYAVEPDRVTRSTVTDRRSIEQLVNAFTDMPVSRLAHSASELTGSGAAGLRFFLRAGGTVELTQLFVRPGEVVVFWQDGSVVGTTWGSAIADSDTLFKSAATTTVDPSERPKSVIP